MAIYSRNPSAYSALKSLGIIQLPCTKTVRGYMKQNCKSPGICEDDLLQYTKQYEDIKLKEVSRVMLFLKLREFLYGMRPR